MHLLPVFNHHQKITYYLAKGPHNNIKKNQILDMLSIRNYMN